MNRSIYFLFALVLLAIAPARSAFAEPTKEQLAQAKIVFGEGAKLMDEGKFAEAADKFKESYRLSEKAPLLYNVGLAFDEAGDKDQALFYYRQFLGKAPKNHDKRKEVTKRLEQLDKEKLAAELNGTSTPTKTTPSVATTSRVEETPKPVKVKPSGTYTAKDFEHQLIEAAPPGKPLDVTAFVPEDAGWTVTLYYRGGGDAKFVAKPMKWRYKELVGRVPAAKMAGNSIQYYVEVKDQAGSVVTRAGKSTSPNLVNIEAGATPRFYPDLTDDGDAAPVTAAEQTRSDLEEDPLDTSQKSRQKDPDPIPTPGLGGETPTDPKDENPNKYSKKKWISTGIAGGLLAGAVLTYVLGKQQASNILADRDARMGNTCPGPPCFEFDPYDIDVQKAGERYNTFHTVTMVTGVLAAGVAGYYWYKERQLKKKLRGSERKPAARDEFVLAPAIGTSFAGAAAAVRF